MLLRLLPLDEILDVRHDHGRLRRCHVQRGEQRVTVRNDRYLERRGKRAHLHEFGDAAGPVRVVLQEVDGAAHKQLLRLPAGVDVLPGGDRHARGVADAPQLPDAFGWNRLLEPCRPNRFEEPRHLNGVLYRPAVEGVEHERIAVAHGFPNGGRHRDVASHAFRAIGRAVTEEPLLRREPELHVLCGPRRRIIRGDREAKHARVGGSRLARRPAQDAVDRQPQRFALEIPERAVHRTETRHEEAAAAVTIHPQHLVVQRFCRQRVAAQQEAPQLLVYHERLVPLDRAEHARRAVVGGDLKVDGGDAA